MSTTMQETQVVIIGGGATGTGILRDLSMRGISAVLLEQGGLAHGTSSRFHGLLHSGARYAVNDPESARECIEENRILRKIASPCVEETEGFFVRTPSDDPSFVDMWTAGCAAAGIEAIAISVEEARRLEPELTPRACEVFRVPDACIDGFRLVWHNALAAREYGGRVFTHQYVTDIEVTNGKVQSVGIRNCITGAQWRLGCEFIVNAAGSWAGEVAHMAGLDVQVSPDRGTLVVFNHRFTSRVVNRLHKSSDGDIFVPHGSVTILGTTSTPAQSPADTTPTSEEVLRLLDIGKELFEDVYNYRILRAFAGTRPLYTPNSSVGRTASRNFHIVDHREEGLTGMAAIFGGKLTTYRLMAERMSDLVCRYFDNTTPCRTAQEPLAKKPSSEALEQASHCFPAQAIPLLVDRLGNDFDRVVNAAHHAKHNRLLCECEMVTSAEATYVAHDPTTHTLSDVRLRTRLGMGTCQGTFCAIRTVGTLYEQNITLARHPAYSVAKFLQERWRGLRPALWGKQLQELELTRAIYGITLDLDSPDMCEVGQQAHIPSPTETVSLTVTDTASETVTQAVMQTVTNTENETTSKHDANSCRTTDIPYTTVTWTPPTSTLPKRRKTVDTVIVGGGIAGLTAALFSAKQGKKVILLQAGNGALSIGSGCIDVLGYHPPHAHIPVQGAVFAALEQAGEATPHQSHLVPHPYRVVGSDAAQKHLSAFAAWAAEEGAPFTMAEDGGNLWLPTVMGTLKPTLYAPQCNNPTPLYQAQRIVVVGIQGFRDYHPQMIIHQLRLHPLLQDKEFSHVLLPSPLGTTHRNSTPLDIARFMETPDGIAWMRKNIMGNIQGADALLIPPICGTSPQNTIWHTLQKALDCPIVEGLSIPPGVGGLRLRTLLRRALATLPVTIIENTSVTRAVVHADQCLGLVTSTYDGEHAYSAAQYVIATGGILGGGIQTAPGLAHEQIFGLPVAVPQNPEAWSKTAVFDTHPITRAGVRVDANLNPTDDHGTALLHNVFFAGRTLGGYDPAREKSGNGVAIVTAIAAVKKGTSYA